MDTATIDQPRQRSYSDAAIDIKHNKTLRSIHMDAIENTRYSSSGRPKGLTNLSEQTKASIVAAKNLQIFSHQRIAQDHNVSRQTVVNMSADKLSPEGKRELESLITKFDRINFKIADRIEEKVDNNDFKDGVYPQLFTAINNARRMENGQSTSNIEIVNYVVQSVHTTLKQQLQLHQLDPVNHPLPTKQRVIESYEATCQKNGVLPDYDAIDLSALDGAETEQG